MSEKYFLYARKSTDVEDKQVLSIEAQVTELRKFAADNNLQIVDTIIEKRTAKMPGRPKFGNILARIEAGEASGILAWHPDRLARNSIDGGQIIYLLDQTRLTSLKFPTFWFENTSQGKFMLSIAFGQSKYYVDNLSENTKRGLRQKLRRGEYPSRAPLGYINDLRTKSIVVDKRIAPIVVEAFELYARNQSRYEDIADFLATHGLVTRGKGTKYKKDRIRVFCLIRFTTGTSCIKVRSMGVRTSRLFPRNFLIKCKRYLPNVDDLARQTIANQKYIADCCAVIRAI